MKLRKTIFKNATLEVVSYVMWSISIWYLVYFQYSGANSIDNSYRLAIWFYMLSGFLFYKDSYIEVTKEMLKSFIILNATNIMSYFLNGNISKELIIIMGCTQITYQMLAYIFVWIIKEHKKLHDRFTLKLQTIFMFILGFFMFIANTSVFFALAVSVIIDLFIGYLYYKKCLKEKAAEEQENCKIIEERTKQVKEIENMREEVSRLRKIEEKYDSIQKNKKKSKKSRKKRKNKNRKRKK